MSALAIRRTSNAALTVAFAGQGADVLTTLVGVAVVGAVEANPLGLPLALLGKLLLLASICALGDEMRARLHWALYAVGVIGFVFATWNTCLMLWAVR